MTAGGRVSGLYLAPDAGEPMDPVDRVEAVAGLTHRGGLNANVVETGPVTIGDPVEPR